MSPLRRHKVRHVIEGMNMPRSGWGWEGTRPRDRHIGSTVLVGGHAHDHGLAPNWPMFEALMRALSDSMFMYLAPPQTVMQVRAVCQTHVNTLRHRAGLLHG